MNEQVKSRKRVIDHGEVFTSKREVNAMLDLVKQETERIDSRFLEPACGTGDFLTEIMNRKLTIVEKRYEDSSLSYTGINKHEGEDIGLYDTVLSRKDFEETFVNEP